MKIQIESTSKIVTVVKDGAEIPARIWQGATESGIEVTCLITRISARADQDLRQFETELQETCAPKADAEVYPLRMIL
jgi:hypothetical protein